jgi:hypothetical protein
MIAKLYVATLKQIVVLDVPSARVLFRVQTRAGLRTAAISPQGRWIFVGTVLGEIAQLAVPTFERQHEDACSQLTRDLSLEEWRDFLGTVPFRKQCPNRK